jgi:hypothetical protein
MPDKLATRVLWVLDACAISLVTDNVPIERGRCMLTLGLGLIH